ncbi:hypothetical protein PR048_024061 [Dryococelus australis]|uniref:Uncharacterized protein n=1 Tax=Dryococelus australis TaxID=614101 RepID=A0ABQ9GVV0_9NEOP|nr:hypothetical protein PR048_024061 [Dryococelus australis]
MYPPIFLQATDRSSLPQFPPALIRPPSAEVSFPKDLNPEHAAFQPTDPRSPIHHLHPLRLMPPAIAPPRPAATSPITRCSVSLKEYVTLSEDCKALRCGVVVRLLASHPGEPSSIPGGVAPGFSQVGIVPDDATSRRVFSGISSFPRPFIPALLHTHFTLIGSQDPDVKTRPKLFTHS